MILAIVLWRLKKDCQDEFLRKWKEEFVINDRSELVGEFLSEPIDATDERLKTLDLANIGQISDDKVVLVNVAIWASEQAFQDQVGRYMKETDAEKRAFEFEVRQRVLLKPVAWRLGDAELPAHDSGKTF